MPYLTRSLLLNFCLLGTYGSRLTAQMDLSLVDTLTALETAVEAREFDRVEELTEFGPHYKNKLAAGRLSVYRAAIPAIERVPVRIQLTGPAYKNRGLRTFTTLDTTPESAPAPTKRRLTGPAYKNRGAKSHQK